MGDAVEQLDTQLRLAGDRSGRRPTRDRIGATEDQRGGNLQLVVRVAPARDRQELAREERPVHADGDSGWDVLGEQRDVGRIESFAEASDLQDRAHHRRRHAPTEQGQAERALVAEQQREPAEARVDPRVWNAQGEHPLKTLGRAQRREKAGPSAPVVTDPADPLDGQRVEQRKHV